MRPSRTPPLLISRSTDEGSRRGRDGEISCREPFNRRAGRRAEQDAGARRCSKAPAPAAAPQSARNRCPRSRRRAAKAITGDPASGRHGRRPLPARTRYTWRHAHARVCSARRDRVPARRSDGSWEQPFDPSASSHICRMDVGARQQGVDCKWWDDYIGASGTCAIVRDQGRRTRVRRLRDRSAGIPVNDSRVRTRRARSWGC